MSQVTLATAVGFYHKGGNSPVDKIEIFIFSEATNHDTNMTARCQQHLERWFRRAFPCVKLFRGYVDNAPTHYRTNKYLSSAVERVLEDKVSRQVVFWGAYHGKTVGDSAGGSLKVV